MTLGPPLEMPMKEEVAQSILHKLGLAAATAALLGGGGMVLKNNVDNTVQDLRIERLEKAVERVEELSDKLDETNANLKLLSAKMEASTADEPRQ